MATLINGDGNAAVYAAQDSDWFAGVEGNTTKILKVGAKMEYEIEDANTIAIKNGVLVTKEGRRVQIDAGAIDEFIIPTGTQGVTRYFIIGYHLYTDASSNQLCETFVQLMANGTDTIPEDTFRGGSTDVYVSLYRVKQDGITLDTIQSLLPEGVDLDGIGDEIDDIKDDIDQINSDLTELSTYVDCGTAKYNETINLPNGWKELGIMIYYQSRFCTLHIYSRMAGSTARVFTAGYYRSSGDYMGCLLSISFSSILVSSINYCGTEATASTNAAAIAYAKVY